jgi:hypothetical protein
MTQVVELMLTIQNISYYQTHTSATLIILKLLKQEKLLKNQSDWLGLQYLLVV